MSNTPNLDRIKAIGKQKVKRQKLTTYQLSLIKKQ